MPPCIKSRHLHSVNSLTVILLNILFYNVRTTFNQYSTAVILKLTWISFYITIGIINVLKLTLFKWPPIMVHTYDLLLEPFALHRTLQGSQKPLGHVGHILNVTHQYTNIHLRVLYTEEQGLICANHIKSHFVVWSSVHTINLVVRSISSGQKYCHGL